MTRWFAVLTAASVIGLGVFAAASAEESQTSPNQSDGMTRGMEEMQRFMNSEEMPQACTAMMNMARQMGDGDAMAGMVRMMQMMGGMGQMGGRMDGMMGPGRAPQRP
jgi:hypothetical protein